MKKYNAYKDGVQVGWDITENRIPLLQKWYKGLLTFKIKEDATT